MTIIRVLLVEDHDLVRAGIRALIENHADIEVCAEASDGSEALRLVHQHKPNVVLMDIAMPRLNGLDTLAHLRQDFPSLPVIMLSMHGEKTYVRAALSLGASGYVLKNSSVAELTTAIIQSAAGERYLTPAISNQVIESFTEKQARTDPLTDGASVSLSERKREILQMIGRGFSTSQIAERLHLSIKTVETHRAQLMQALGVTNLAGLVRAAIRLGLVSPDDPT